MFVVQMGERETKKKVYVDKNVLKKKGIVFN
jgi:hypothetical protein